MVLNHRWFLSLIRLGSLALFCLLLALGCSGKGGPVSPDLRNGNPSDTGLAQNPAVQVGNPAGMVSTGTRTGQAKEYIDNEVLVVLQKGIAQTQAGNAMRSYALQLRKAIVCRWGTVYELLITDGTTVMDMVNRLKADPLVRMAEPNRIYTFDEVPYFPNDPMWEGDDPGNDPRDNVYEQWGPANIGASIVWNESKGSSDVVVAVIDTGVRKDHEDLTANLWVNEDEIPDNGIDDDSNGWIDDTWGWNCVQEDNNPYDDGDYANYHGTACAGVVAAIQDNLRGVTGVAPGIKVMAIKTDLTGSGAFVSTVVEGLEYARKNGADICSMSFGDFSPSDIMEAECIDCWDNGDGVILMASAGNEDSTTIRYPSAYDSVLTVGATIPRDPEYNPIDEARISADIGFYWGSCYGDQLVVMGYGAQYTTTYGGHYDGYWDGIDFDFFGGTSCACPMSAGVMALIKSFFPEENGQWCWDRIKDTADDLDEPGFDIQTGYGRCNALRAVYGPDRYKAQEDALGFVTLSIPDAQVFDSIHDVDGNPYQDKEDLYRFTSTEDGSIEIYLDIFTWGENLDMAVYSDEAMTQLVDSATTENHANSSFEELFLNVTAGQEFFVKVYSPLVGNSSTYGLRIHQMTNDLWVSGESTAPSFIHQQGQKVPFLKLKFEAGSAATLNEVIINKHGTLPNEKWINASLYEDSNGNGMLDKNDALVAQKYPQARNRVRMDGLNIEWNYHIPLVLFFAADFAQTLVDSTVSFSLETYKDVTTAEGIVAGYDEFPITSDELLIGTDAQSPQWVGTVGIQMVEPSYASVKIGWNEATDLLTPPVKYNIYYSDALPFDVATATKLAEVNFKDGTTTDYRFTVTNLPKDIEQHFVVRAEDQAGNEDQNLVVLSATPTSGGDPEQPMVLATFPLSGPYDVSVSHNLLTVADGWSGLKVFDRTDPINLEEVGLWYGDSVYGVLCDAPYVYCGGYDYFSVVNLTTPSAPQLMDYTDFWYGYSVAKLGNWVYCVGSYGGTVLPVDVTDPANVQPKPEVVLYGYGYPYDIQLTQKYMYVANYYDGIEAFDRTSPGSPVYENTFGDYYIISEAIDAGTLYGVDNSSGAISSYDIGSNPSSPPMLDSTTGGPGYSNYSVIIIGDYAYVARQDYGIVTFDVSTPADIKFVGQLALPGVVALATDGTLVYAVGTDPSSYEGWLCVII